MDTRVIKTSAEYEKVMEELENLIALDPEPGTDEAERLDLLSLLVESYESENFPVELPNPIDAIRFRMDEQGLKPRDLIPLVGSKSKVSEILAGKRTLTVPMIRALHSALDIPLEVLIQTQSAAAPENCDDVTIWDRFPLKEMVKRQWITAEYNELEQHWDKLLSRFFEPLGGPRPVEALCRRTLVERSGKEMDKYALWAWTARVLIVAQSTDLPRYQPGTVDDSFMQTLVRLSLSDKGPNKAQDYLMDHGIAVVVEPHLPRTRLDGAAMLSGDGTPVIGLTIRHDRIDNFWFTLVHELIHVQRHLEANDEAFIDDLESEPGNDPREREADNAATETLIPRAVWRRSDAFHQRSPDSVNELALQLGIHPAIIAGRIRHDTKNFRILGQMVGTGKVRKFWPDIRWP
jgi:HTH-type transcriptional regulator/antitoxin HigA